MKLKEGNPLRLIGSNGEQITVTVRGTGIVEPPVYVLDDAPWPGGAFTLNKAARNPSLLTVTLVFTSNSGGSFAIELTGSQGGVSRYQYNQKTNEASRVTNFLLDVNGP